MKFIFAIAVLSFACHAAPPEMQPFIQKHCLECHDGDAEKGGLNLEKLAFELGNAEVFGRWVKVHDRVAAGEMPPPKEAHPDAGELAGFTNFLAQGLMAADRRLVAEEGRATKRRLNRYEYEETLRDLLGLPYLEVKAFLPEDTEAHGFNKIGDALDVSHVQMGRYLTAAEFALRQAMVPQTSRPEVQTNRYYTWEEREFWGKIKLEGPLNRRTFPLVGLELQTNIMAEARPRMPRTTDAERREREAMAVVVSTYEPTEIRFGGFRAPIAGRYRLRFSGYSVQMGPKFTEASRGRR